MTATLHLVTRMLGPGQPPILGSRVDLHSGPYRNQLLSAWPDRGAKYGAMPGLSARANEGVFCMPELRLDDGTILALPDDATPAEIAELVARHYRVATPVEARQSPQAIQGSRMRSPW